MTKPSTQSRIRGVALGAAIGDALGMPLEFRAPSPPNNLLREIVSGRLPAGSITDDTEMALALVESLIAYRPLDAVDLSARFVDWFKRDPADYGFQTASMLRQISRGLNWEAAASRSRRDAPDSAGNGSVMRCWPVALAYLQDPAQLLVDSELQSLVIHPHPECVAGCLFINALLRELILGSEPGYAIKKICADISIPPGLLEVIEKAPKRKREELSNSGWVRHTLESVIWGLMNTQSFEDAMVEVVNLGHDADTAGSVIGALAGALYGVEGIPERWKIALKAEWPIHSGQYLLAKDFIELADELAAGISA